MTLDDVKRRVEGGAIGGVADAPSGPIDVFHEERPDAWAGRCPHEGQPLDDHDWRSMRTVTWDDGTLHEVPACLFHQR